MHHAATALRSAAVSMRNVKVGVGVGIGVGNSDVVGGSDMVGAAVGVGVGKRVGSNDVVGEAVPGKHAVLSVFGYPGHAMQLAAFPYDAVPGAQGEQVLPS